MEGALMVMEGALMVMEGALMVMGERRAGSR